MKKVQNVSLKAAALLATMVALPAQAQLLLPNSPIRVQVGNGQSLIGPKSATSAIGVSVLSRQNGTNAGTSVRLLGPTKTVGLASKSLGASAKVTTPLDPITAQLLKK